MENLEVQNDVAAETQALPREDDAPVTAMNTEAGTEHEAPENIPQTFSESLENSLRGTPGNPIGTQNPAHRFFWKGKDINGNEHVGSGDNASQCNVDAGLQGSCTCHLSTNSDFIEPIVAPVVPEAPPTPRELNAFYAAGHVDGLRYFEEIKALILAWATEQALSGGVADVDALPFIVYARHNP